MGLRAGGRTGASRGAPEGPGSGGGAQGGSIHSGCIAAVHNVPLSVLIRPLPSVLDPAKVQSLVDTIRGFQWRRREGRALRPASRPFKNPVRIRQPPEGMSARPRHCRTVPQALRTDGQRDRRTDGSSFHPHGNTTRGDWGPGFPDGETDHFPGSPTRARPWLTGLDSPALESSPSSAGCEHREIQWKTTPSSAIGKPADSKCQGDVGRGASHALLMGVWTVMVRCGWVILGYGCVILWAPVILPWVRILPNTHRSP
ncbi:sulfiredoxin-1 isoform X1 [Urocitellus parryii]